MFAQVDAILATGDGDETFEKVNTVGIKCGEAGLSLMVRKDNQVKYKWLTEGMKKIRESGDFHWLCNLFGEGK